jgi:hypothetical protein
MTRRVLCYSAVILDKQHYGYRNKSDLPETSKVNAKMWSLSEIETSVLYCQEAQKLINIETDFALS